ncbi:hypothetical protein ACFLSW_05380, partial [Candidatus Bipolaricaulota bacterium]
MNRRLGVLVAIVIAVVTLSALSALATDAQMYFSSDKNGQNRVTNVQEGDEIWIVVTDNDQNIDCDIRDKMWPDAKIMDPKTGAYIIWDTGEGTLADDYLEETGADTGVFVSKRAFQIGTREDYAEEHKNTHVVDQESSPPDEFMWGAYLYSDIEQENVPLKGVPGVRGDIQRWVGAYGTGSPLAYDVGFVYALLGDYEVPSDLETTRREVPSKWLIGRFENMDTLVGMYQDPNHLGDVAIAMMKIIDVEATIAWDREIYKDANSTATITVADADENLNCNQVEYVPVFILVNPGGWNPAGTSEIGTDQTNDSPNNFCMLKRTGGVDASDPDPTSNVGDYRPIRWFNIYNAEKNDFGTSGAEDGRYYVQYPDLGEDIDIHKQLFDTANGDGITAVSFYAQETGVNTGIFQLNLNSILEDLGFNSLRVRDVLVAYYLDPNDEDDFKLATAYIEERQHSISSFTDATRADKDLYWIGRDPVYVQVIDANANVDPCCPEDVIAHICDPHGEDDGEFWVLHETSSNSPVFFSTAGMELLPVWDALGVGVGDATGDMLGGYQLVLDNWKLETFNEDEVYVRYNDVQYMAGDNGYAGLADISTITAYSGPRIGRIRVGNDVSFDLMSIADTQVFDGTTTQMWFLDRQGNRVSGYATSDCLFIEVLDLDQDEDQYRRERIDAFWDGGQNYPFGPVPRNVFGCQFERVERHPVNDLLGDTNVFNDSPDPYESREDGAAKIYVLNPRNGRWAGIDLLETGAATGDFVSVVCIDLVHVYECVPTLGVLPGDTVIAFYQDPSNHSDSAMISIKVGIGGGGTPPSQQSTTMFVDADGNEVANYTDADTVYVKVIDPSHAGATLLASAVDIDGVTYDLTPFGAAATFITEGLDLGLTAGDSLTAEYTDPTDLTDTSADTITVIASVLVVDSFYAGPNPFEGEVTFGFNGTGVASTMSVAIYNLAGGVVYETTQTDV